MSLDEMIGLSGLNYICIYIWLYTKLCEKNATTYYISMAVYKLWVSLALPPKRERVMSIGLGLVNISWSGESYRYNKKTVGLSNTG